MFISQKQVEDYFFFGIDPRRARERIFELERAGYVFRTKTYGESKHTLIRLTISGLSIALENTDLEIKPRTKVDFSTLEHDLRLIDIRVQLEKCWTNFRWIPERAIRTADYPEVPDALCVFQNNQKIAIEFENSLKSEARIIRLLSRWRETDVSLVIYFTSHPGINRKYERLLKSHSFGVEIRVIDVRAFLTHGFRDDLSDDRLRI